MGGKISFSDVNNKPKWTREYWTEYQRQYYQDNKDRIRQYYLDNRPYFLAYKREYYQHNREYLCLKMRLNYRLNLMKVAFNESLKWESSKQGPNPEAWKVLPVNFATEHKQMLAHLHKQRILGYS